jgi:Outer membrane lipoprotein-sorting protein
MHRPQPRILFLILLSVVVSLWSCRAHSSGEVRNGKQPEPAKAPLDPAHDGGPIVSETIGHFRVETYSATVNISKTYKNGLRFDDVLHLYSKLDQQDHVRVLISVKPQAERKGAGMLAEIQNKQLVSGYRFIPDTKTIVPISPAQEFSNVVLGGLSLEDFQMVQGVSPFSETRVTSREEVNGKLCDVLEVVFIDQSQYQQGKLFTTVAERLPVLVQAFNQKGDLVKEIVFDKVERLGKVWVARQLTVREKSFDYTSTFNFEDVKVNSSIEDSIFTQEFLQKGWQEPVEKNRPR